MIKVNANKCIGCGLCVSVCPKIFKMNSSGQSEVIAQNDEKCAQQSALACPVGAISVEK